MLDERAMAEREREIRNSGAGVEGVALCGVARFEAFVTIRVNQ